MTGTVRILEGTGRADAPNWVVWNLGLPRQPFRKAQTGILFLRNG